MEPHDRLKQAREMAGYDTPGEAADALKIIRSTYYAHENGSRGFIKPATKYAQFFGCNLVWLLNEEGEPNFKTDARKNRPLPSQVELDRDLLLRIMETAFQCVSEIDPHVARDFAQSVLEIAERQQAVPPARRDKDLTRTLALSASRLFSSPKS